MVEQAGRSLSRGQKGRDGKTPFERLHGQKPTQEFVPFGEKVLANHHRSRINPWYKYGIWLGMRNNNAECFMGNADGVFRAREIRTSVQAEDTSEMVIGESTALPAAPSVNTRRRIVVKSEPVAVTSQEAVDGHCEKAMSIGSVEQIELGNIMELSITGQVIKWARRSNLCG